VSLELTVTSYHRLSPDIQIRQTVGEGPFTIGRGSACDWVLVDTEKLLSKHHVTIARADGGYRITDHSLNGAYLNAESAPIGRGVSRPLHDGDRIRLSDYEIAVAIRADVDSDDACDVSESVPPAFGETPAPAAVPEVPPGSWLASGGGPDSGWRVGPAAPAAPALRGGAPLPPNAALLDDDDAAEQVEPGEMPAWSPEGERVALRPSRPAIPEDWQEQEGHPDSAPGPEAEPAPPAGASPFAPPGMADAALAEGDGGTVPPRSAAGETPASPSAGAEPAAEGDGYLAFLRGAGLSPEVVGDVDREAAMAEAGRLFATVVEGLMEVLATRSEVRNAFRLQQTVIRPRENNPLKFSATTTDALRALMTGRSRGYMPARQAVEEAVDDVKAHQIAVMAGVQGALKGLLHRFDPETLERRFGAERGVLGLGSRKGRAWDEFVRLYDEIAAEAEDDFHAVLGREFAKAYESCGRSRRSGG